MRLFVATKRELLLHLSLIPGVGPSVVERLLNTINADDFYHMSPSDLMGMSGITEAMATRIVRGLRDQSMLDAELLLIKKHAINWVALSDATYPSLLRHISRPPLIIYWRGSFSDQEKRIAIVGSRKANRYGKKVINFLVCGLVSSDWVIVSGGAYGADTMAHQAAIANKGKTIVVLGSGLLRPYPAANEKLFETVCELGGTVISTFSLHSDPVPGNFPARNRIISGLSYGCVIVQAAEKSGAIITAHAALEQGRNVYAVPGPIDDSLSIGCHYLIQQGAQLISSPHDIIESFSDIYESSAVCVNKQENNKQQAVSTQKDVLHHKVKKSPIQEKLLASCVDPATIDDILDETGLTSEEVMSCLFELQLEGIIDQNLAGLWYQR